MHAARADELEGIDIKEKMLLKMVFEEKAEYFAKRMQGCKLAKLRVSLKDLQTVLWQIPHSTRMNTSSGR